MLKLNIKPTAQRTKPSSRTSSTFNPRVNHFAVAKRSPFVQIQHRFVYDQKEFDKFKFDPKGEKDANKLGEKVEKVANKFGEKVEKVEKATEQFANKVGDKAEKVGKATEQFASNVGEKVANKFGEKAEKTTEQYANKFGDKAEKMEKKDTEKYANKSSMKKDYMLHEINPALRIGSRVLPEDKFEIFVQFNENASSNKELLDTILNATKVAAKQYASGGIISKTVEGVMNAAESIPGPIKSTISTAANVASKLASATGSVASTVASKVASATEKVAPKVVSETGEKLKEGAVYAAETMLGREINTESKDNATRISIPNKGTIVWTQFESDPKNEKKEGQKNLNRSENEKWDELSYSFEKTEETKKFFDDKVGTSEKAQIAMDLLKKEFSSLPFGDKLVDRLSSIPLEKKMVNDNPSQQSSS